MMEDEDLAKTQPQSEPQEKHREGTVREHRTANSEAPFRLVSLGSFRIYSRFVSL